MLALGTSFHRSRELLYYARRNAMLASCEKNPMVRLRKFIQPRFYLCSKCWRTCVWFMVYFWVIYRHNLWLTHHKNWWDLWTNAWSLVFLFLLILCLLTARMCIIMMAPSLLSCFCFLLIFSRKFSRSTLGWKEFSLKTNGYVCWKEYAANHPILLQSKKRLCCSIWIVYEEPKLSILCWPVCLIS